MSSKSDLTELLGALETRDHVAVARLIASLIGAAPRLGDRWAQLARAALNIGENDLANAAMALRSTQSPGDAAACFDQAATLATTNRPADARVLLASLPQSIPDPASYWYLRGTLDLNLGDLDAASSALERAVSFNPASGQTWLALAATCKAKHATGLIDRLNAMAPRMATQIPLERACFHYALCKVLKDVEDHHGAFAQAQLAGSICRAERIYKVDQDRAHAAGIIESYSSTQIEELSSRCGDRTIAPIFILGLPRSGTTLLQQILASHTAVATGGELGRLPVMIRRMGGAKPHQVVDYSERNRGLGPAALYQHLARLEDRSAGIMLDKSIENTRYAGLIKAIMPESKLIWIRRDPLAVAWSAFSTYFARSLNWSFALADIASHLALEQRMHAHWAKVLGDEILQVDYEDLVRNSVAGIERILKHCGLEWQEGPFQHHRSTGTIATASVVQAREPIYQSSIEGAEPYRPFLQPFLDAYSQATSEDIMLR